MNDCVESELYQKLKEQCEAQVTRWEWGTAYLHELRPFYTERLGFTSGKWLPREPKKKQGKHEYGLDESGRLIVDRQYTSFPMQVYETFYTYTNEMAEAIRFKHYDKKTPSSISRFFFKDAHIIEWEGKFHAKTNRSIYIYDSDRLIQSVYIENDGDPRTPAIESQTRTFKYLYNKHGQLDRIEQLYHNGTHFVIYQLVEGNVAPILKRAEALLLDVIPSTVKKLELTESAYCIALVYTDDYFMLPPELAIGLERQRQAWGAEAVEYLWSPEDFEMFASGSEVGGFAKKRKELELDNKVLIQLGIEIGYHLLAGGSEAPAHQLLVKVAKKLNKYNWSDILPITDDFIVCPVSLERGVDSEDLKVCVPASQRSKLQNKGFIS